MPEIAERYAAVVSSEGIIADPAGAVWQVSAGRDGLATSGSGDVLAGALGVSLGAAPKAPSQRSGRPTLTRRRETGWLPASAGWGFLPARSSMSCRAFWLSSRPEFCEITDLVSPRVDAPTAERVGPSSRWPWAQPTIRWTTKLGLAAIDQLSRTAS